MPIIIAISQTDVFIENLSKYVNLLIFGLIKEGADPNEPTPP